jgi:hypothetical protein
MKGIFAIVKSQRSYSYGSVSMVALLLSSCILNPYAEYRRQYEQWPIGHTFAEYFPNSGPPLRVEDKPDGAKIYVYNAWPQTPKYVCVQYYEVRNNVIVSAWHEGKNCLVTH